jgi:hypothetical protein
LDQRLL